MRAFVLSGGGNYGPLQVGALQALLQRGICPDLLVGTSAGALNAAWFASEPTANGLRQLARLWTDYAPRLYGSYNQLALLYHLAHTRESILPNQRLLELLSRWMPPGKRFGEFSTPRLYTVAAQLESGRMHVFGDDPEEFLLDGLMASTALPPLFSPWVIDQVAYVDGGVVANLPLRAAVERGAREIYALLVCSRPTDNSQRGVISVSIRSIMMMVNQQVDLEIERVRQETDTRLHLIRLCPSADPGFWNFESAADLIHDGYRAVEEQLHPQIEN